MRHDILSVWICACGLDLWRSLAFDSESGSSFFGTCDSSLDTCHFTRLSNKSCCSPSDLSHFGPGSSLLATNGQSDVMCGCCTCVSPPGTFVRVAKGWAWDWLWAILATLWPRCWLFKHFENSPWGKAVGKASSPHPCCCDRSWVQRSWWQPWAIDFSLVSLQSLKASQVRDAILVSSSFFSFMSHLCILAVADGNPDLVW